jgi:hypothetical protein
MTQTSARVQDDRESSILELTGRPQQSHLHTVKASRKLPLQNKCAESVLQITAQATMDQLSSFSSGLCISNLDDLFDPTVGVTTVPMTCNTRDQCHKVLNGLIRRNSNNAIWFLKPVNDPRLVDDYKAK